MNILFKKSVSMVALATMLASSAPSAFAVAAINDGDLVKASGSSAVYLVKGSTLRTFPYSTIYHSWGFPSNYSTVKTVAASDLASYTVGDPVPFRDGSCFRGTAKSLPGFESQAVFCVSDGQLRPVESQNAFFGLFNVTNWTQGNKYVQFIPDDFLSKFDFAFGTKVTETEVNSGVLMNGLVVKGSVDGAYYLVQDGKLRAISNSAAIANKIDLSKAVVTAQTKINAISSALPVSESVETSLVTPKTKAQAEASGTVADITKATKLVVSADKTSVEADGATKVTVTAKVATNEGATVSSATNNVTFAITSGSGTLSATTVAAVNGIATVKLTPSTVASTIVVSASATGLTAGNVSVTTTANTLAPSVVSVANTGMRIINVSFDKTLDKTSAETTTNYNVKSDKSSSVSVSDAKLLADGKTVQLFLGSSTNNNSVVDSIEIKDVQNSSQTSTMTTVTKELTITDSSVPTVVAVEALGSKAVRVTFSEAVQGVAIGAFRMDDKTLHADDTPDETSKLYNVSVTYPDAGDYTKALISFDNGLTVGAHTLTVGVNNSIKDHNSTTNGISDVNTYNVMQAAGYVATVSADTNVPQLSSVELLTQTKARYTFSKPVNVAPTVYTAGVVTSAGDVNSFFWSTSSTATSGPSANKVTKVSDTVYEVTWESAINTGTVYFYAGSTSNKVTDYSGNSISPMPSSRSLVVTTDTAPAISSVSMDTGSDRKVVVYFNKDVDEASAQTSGNYVFKSTNGTVLTSTTGGEGISSNGNPIATPDRDDTNLKKVTITLGGDDQDANALPGGTYMLEVKDVKTSGGTTAMSAASYTFTVTDKTRPTLKSKVNDLTVDNASAAANRIVLKFSEPLDAASATNTQNYKISNYKELVNSKLTPKEATVKLSDISGASITLRNSNKDVVITFPDTTVISEDTTITIGNVDAGYTGSITDVSGNKFKASPEGATYALSKNLSGAGVFSSSAITSGVTLKVKSPTLLQATFAREIESISASEFRISNGVNSNINPSSAEICTAKSTNCEEENAKVVMFTIPSGSTNEFTSNDKTSVILKTQEISKNNGKLTSKDTLNLSIGGVNTSPTTPLVVTLGSSATNDIKPVMKSFAMVDNNTIAITFDGKIDVNAMDTSDFIISQSVNGTVTTYTGSQLIVDTSVDSTVVQISLKDLSKQFSPIDTDVVTVRTVAGDSMRSIGLNGAKIAANTTGIQNASFVATTVSEAIIANGTTGYGAAIASGDALTVTFNKSVNRTSIAGTWTDAGYGYGVYTQTGVSASFNGSTNKMSVNGVGEFEFSDLYVTDGNGSGSSSAVVSLSLNTNTNTVVIVLGTATFNAADGTVASVTTTSSPKQTYYVASGSDTITFTPASGIKTTVGTPISADQKPVTTTN